MTICNQTDIDKFIDRVRELANNDLKLALFAIDPDGRIVEDFETLPPQSTSPDPCPTDSNALLPSLDLPASKIKQAISISINTYESSPPTTFLCKPNIHGQWTCSSGF